MSPFEDSIEGWSLQQIKKVQLFVDIKLICYFSHSLQLNFLQIALITQFVTDSTRNEVLIGPMYILQSLQSLMVI